MSDFDVIVVGGGHAGCEAALASARIGAKTALVTVRRDAIAKMHCNPSIGGIAKSHLVFELDALGGEMARNADYTGIQFRILNTRKGPAVQANRAQSDKDAYAARMRDVISCTHNLTTIVGMVSRIALDGRRAVGVVVSGSEPATAKAIVLTPGTSLHGAIHIGHDCHPGGGSDLPSCDELSQQLSELGFRLGRLKTGTPPRLDKDSIDFDALDAQDGMTPAPLFSLVGRRDKDLFHVEQMEDSADICRMFHVEHSTRAMRPWAPGSDQMPCHMTHTTAATKQIVADNLTSSSLYGGRIVGTGARYCPSFEDKVVKFPEKDSHHVFLEPEGRNSSTIYPNGISNSLPIEIQERVIHSVPGLDQATVREWAYAIEYDYSDPTKLWHTFETKPIEALFMAGQINGTTGYEEAAAQGFIAGVNAARMALGMKPLTIHRHEAYIGIMIDDLVTRGTSEPYRMFTSRAQNRLVLRQDNARYRLRRMAEEIGIVDQRTLNETDGLASAIEGELSRLATVRHGQHTLLELLRRPEMTCRSLPVPNSELATEAATQVEIIVKYAGYIEREQREIQRLAGAESVSIPVTFDYWSLKVLRREAKERLDQIRPGTLGQAARIPGITPADISVLSIILRSRRVHPTCL